MTREQLKETLEDILSVELLDAEEVVQNDLGLMIRFDDGSVFQLNVQTLKEVEEESEDEEDDEFDDEDSDT